VSGDGREREGAALWVVGAVQPDSGRLGVTVYLIVHIGVTGGGDGEAVRGHLATPVGAFVPPDTAVVGDLVDGGGGDHGDVGAGVEEAGHLAGGDRSCADDEDAPTGEVQVDGVGGGAHRWIPHSVLAVPAQRPLLVSQPTAARSVQGQQPMES